MLDEKLDELIQDIKAKESIYNEVTGTAVTPSLFDLRAAEERLRNYLNERKEENGFI